MTQVNLFNQATATENSFAKRIPVGNGCARINAAGGWPRPQQLGWHTERITNIIKSHGPLQLRYARWQATKKGGRPPSRAIVTDPGAASAYWPCTLGWFICLLFIISPTTGKYQAIWPRGGVNQLMGSGHGDGETARAQTTRSWSKMVSRSTGRDCRAETIRISRYQGSFLHFHFIWFLLLFVSLFLLRPAKRSHCSQRQNVKTMNFFLRDAEIKI